MSEIAEILKHAVELGIVPGSQMKTLIDEFDSPVSASTRDRSAVRNMAKELEYRGLVTDLQAEAMGRNRLEELVYGPYICQDKLGEGGMGCVYRAWHPHLKRHAAIKTIHLKNFGNPEVRKRFEREIEAAGRLEHPNLIAALDAKCRDDEFYLITEYVDGVNLQDLVGPHDPLPWRQACELILQAAEGLVCAHEVGIVHRDIKPGNLMLSKKGVVKVLDLGLARLADSADNLTHTQDVMGTPDYMAPEQCASSARVEHYCDIYSLGFTLFYLCVGHPPYHQEKNNYAKFLAHNTGTLPRLRDFCLDAPEALETLFRRMAAKEPQNRHASMHDVVIDLRQLLGLTSTEKAPAVKIQEPEPIDIPTRADVSVIPTHRPEPLFNSAKSSSPSLKDSKSTQFDSLSNRTKASLGHEVSVHVSGTKTRNPHQSTPPQSVKPVVKADPVPEPPVINLHDLLGDEIEPDDQAHGLEPPPSPDHGAKWPYLLAAAIVSVVLIGLATIIFSRLRGPAAPKSSPASYAGDAKPAPNPDQSTKTASNQPTKEQSQLVADLEDRSKHQPKPDISKPSNKSSTETPSTAKVDPVPSPEPAKTLTSNESGIKLLYIAPGEYTRGSNKNEGEKPPHKVRITQGFYMGETEVTLGQWRKIMPEDIGGGETNDHPVSQVSWLDCVKFCNELSKKENLPAFYDLTDENNVRIPDRDGKGYRLPTEAEWEYACRAGATTEYPFGSDVKPLGDYAWYGEGINGKTHAVRQKKPNAWGFYDMLGNAYEWCEDWYDGKEYSKYTDGKIAINPAGPETGMFRLLRGGSYIGLAGGTHPTYRNLVRPSNRSAYYGFRVSRALP